MLRGDPVIDLRVLMFNPLFHPVVGGAERQTELLMAALIERGVSTEVLTVRMETEWPLTETRPGGVRVRRIAFNDLSRKFPRLRGLGVLNTLLLGRQVSREIDKLSDGFDVLHAFNASQPSTAFAVRAARAASLPTIVRAVNSREWFDLAVLRKEPFWGPMTCRWLLQDVDCWIAISAAVAEELAAAGVGPSRIRRLPNGVVLPESPRELPPLASRFLHLGRLARTAPRDISGLIVAFEAVAANDPEAELALVGDGDQLQSVRQLVAASPAAKRIQVPGRSDGGSWRNWAHCLVQPSFVEGMSNALLEGMAAGLPCIAYDIPPNREVMGDDPAGILVPVGDRAALARALISVATVPELARQLGQRARKRAEATYDIQRTVPDTVRLYRELVSRCR